MSNLIERANALTKRVYELQHVQDTHLEYVEGCGLCNLELSASLEEVEQLTNEQVRHLNRTSPLDDEYVDDGLPW